MRASLRLRVAAWYAGLLTVAIAILGLFLIVQLRSDLTRAIDVALRPAAAQIADDVRVDGPSEFRDSSRSVLKGERAASQLLDGRGSILATFGDPVADRPMATAVQVAAAAAGGRPVAARTLGQDQDDFRVVAAGAVRRGRRYVVVAAQASEPVDRSVGRVTTLLLLGGPAALLATALAGWWLARRALRPIEHMTGTAAAIGVDRLGERVPVWRSNDEVAHLARTFNTMLDRIQHGVDEQRRLVADTSHELRTPLAAMRAELDVSLHADALPPAAREVLLSAREEVDRMGQTVAGLLTLAAADGGVLHLDPVPLDLAALGASVAEQLAPVARRRGVEVVSEGPRVAVRADAARLGQAIRNLLENAIEFSPPRGTVHVTTERDGGTARLSVTDEGPGIPEHLAERVFDRFFRVDPSRSRATGGSGLGLAICREIAEAHGGRARFERRERGSTFVLELPAGDGGSLAGVPAPAPRPRAPRR